MPSREQMGMKQHAISRADGHGTRSIPEGTSPEVSFGNQWLPINLYSSRVVVNWSYPFLILPSHKSYRYKSFQHKRWPPRRYSCSNVACAVRPEQLLSP